MVEPSQQVQPRNFSPNRELLPDSATFGNKLRQELKIGIIYNPIAGQGRGEALAEEIRAYCELQGFQVTQMPSSRTYVKNAVSDFLRGADRVVIIGGDGTVMGLLPHIIEAGVPMYVYPGGNESLVSKQFGMSRDLEAMSRRLESPESTQHYVGCFTSGGERKMFCLMASVGLDSMVVAKVSKDRSAPVGTIGYVLPTIRAVLEYEAPRITLSVDGKICLKNEPGFLIVAKSSRYARNLNLVPEADTTKQELCARFFPGTYLGPYMDLIGRLISGKNADLTETRLFRGRRFELSIDSKLPYPIQVDGDIGGVGSAILEVSEATVKIL